MSDNELEKLAAAMQNIKPSKDARKRGLAAAMAAFDTEFAAEVVQENTIAEKNLNTSQGLADAPRLTEQTTQATWVDRVQSFGRDAMRQTKSKTNKFFTFTPKATMMAGSCAAALIASFIYVESGSFDHAIEPQLAPAPVVVDVNSVAPTVVEGPFVEAPVVTSPVVNMPVTQAPEPEVSKIDAPQIDAPQIERPIAQTPASNLAESKAPLLNSEAAVPEFEVAPSASEKRAGGISSISSLLDKVRSDAVMSETGNRQREAEFRQRSNGQGDLLAKSTTEQRQAIQEFRDAAQQRDNISFFKNSQGIFSINKSGITADTSNNESVKAQSGAVPVITKEVTRRVIKTPASTQERIVPEISKLETRRVVKPDGSFETISEQVIVQEATTQLIVTPPIYETITEIVVVEPNNDQFETYEVNPITAVEETPVSTFSIDVDTAAYSYLRASINRGQLPPPRSIRLEELINYFPYDYDAPKSADEPFKANVTVTPTPWNTDTKLMHIGIKGYVPPAAERPPSNIVLLIDTSGSMRAQNKLPLLINSFKLLLGTLDEDDTVSIVTYAGSAGTVLEPTSAKEKGKIKAALSNLRSGGSTAGAAGLELAYNKALESFDKDGVNRVILATDGDFNVGFSSHEEMKNFIEKKRNTGIFLSVLGFGRGNYNDQLMQALAQNGNGVAAYIDTLAEANKVLADEAGSALMTIAKDVKIQVEFNPSVISEYRLIGYETRALNRQDFNNDKVDAGEIGSGHSVTAIYEMTPVGSPAISVDALRYTSSDSKPLDTGSDEYAFVKIRHKLPTSDTSTLQTFPVGVDQERSLKHASKDMRFATAVAAVGQKLRGDTQLDDFSYQDAIKLAKNARGEDEHGYRAEFVQLIRLIDGLDDQGQDGQALSGQGQDGQELDAQERRR